MAEKFSKVKWARVYRTVCEMARDRGYVDDANGLLKDLSTEDLMKIQEQNMETLYLSNQKLNFPPFAHKMNDDAFYSIQDQKVNQFLYVFHYQKLRMDDLRTIDNVIQIKQRDYQQQNQLSITFVNVIILIDEDVDSKDAVPKKVQDVIIILNKEYKDEMEFCEKIWVDKSMNKQRKQDRGVSDQKIFTKYDLINFEDLVINITKHQLVPTHVPLDCIEKRTLMDKYKINDSQLPKILLTDPITKYFGLRSRQVFKIERDSETAGKYITYRIVS